MSARLKAPPPVMPVLVFDEWTPVGFMPKPDTSDAIPTRRLYGPGAEPRITHANLGRATGASFGPRWRDVPDAPLSLTEANRLVEAGVLLKANRVKEEGTYVVIRTHPDYLPKYATLTLQSRGKWG